MTPDSIRRQPSDEISAVFSILLLLAAAFILVGIGLSAWEFFFDYRSETAPPAFIFNLIPLW